MNLYDSGLAPLMEMLGNIPAWLDKAQAGGADEAQVMASRLAPDMHPFPRQIQIACDMLKLGAARLAGVEAPSMPDGEASFAELKARVEKTLAFVEGLDRTALAAAEDRRIEFSVSNGMVFGFSGAEYLTHWVGPNVYFHATTTYALLRAAGVGLGKADFLAHGARFVKGAGAA